MNFKMISGRILICEKIHQCCFNDCLCEYSLKNMCQYSIADDKLVFLNALLDQIDYMEYVLFFFDLISLCFE